MFIVTSLVYFLVPLKPSMENHKPITGRINRYMDFTLCSACVISTLGSKLAKSVYFSNESIFTISPS